MYLQKMIKWFFAMTGCSFLHANLWLEQRNQIHTFCYCGQVNVDKHRHSQHHCFPFGIASDYFIWNQSYLIMVFAWSSTSLVMQLACLASFGKHTVTLTGQSSSGQVLMLLKYRFTVFLPYKLYSTNQYIHLDNSLCSNKYICQEKVQPTIGVVEYWGNKKES